MDRGLVKETSMKHLLVVLGIAATFLGSSGQTSADFLYTSPGGMANLNSYTGTLGTEFKVTSSTQVFALGIYDPNGAALLSSHAVGIWLVGGSSTPIATATVPSGTAGTLLNNFRYASIGSGSITLTAGNTYIIGAVMTSGGDVYKTYYDTTNGPAPTYGSTINTTSGSMPTSAYDSTDNPNLTEPNTTPGGDSGYIGPNFDTTSLVAAVPEPSSWVLAGFGTLGLVGYVWRTRRRFAAA
jgi:hypothetical protein